MARLKSFVFAHSEDGTSVPLARGTEHEDIPTEFLAVLVENDLFDGPVDLPAAPEASVEPAAPAEPVVPAAPAEPVAPAAPKKTRAPRKSAAQKKAEAETAADETAGE